MHEKEVYDLLIDDWIPRESVIFAETEFPKYIKSLVKRRRDLGEIGATVLTHYEDILDGTERVYRGQYKDTAVHRLYRKYVDKWLELMKKEYPGKRIL